VRSAGGLQAASDLGAPHVSRQFAAAQFSSPQGIAVSGGLAYVVDIGNNRTEKWVVVE
jgi:hypothetical protein